MLDGPLAATTGSFRAPFPQLAVTNDLAVIAPATLVVSVVPVMLGTDDLAVASFRCEAKIDQEPWQSATQPRTPFVGVAAHPLSRSSIRLTRCI